MSKRYLFYVSQNYSYEILRPLQAEILQRGDECSWFLEGDEVNSDYLTADEKRLMTIEDAVNYQPYAVLVPGNTVPSFISGTKVQVFHGLEWKKKGHFVIRGFFDLYCTHGKLTTERFYQLKAQHGHFDVIETGWPKLDPLFNTPALNVDTDKPIVLFAPTFSPSLTCAPILFEEIEHLAKKKPWHWLVKFHPKMAPEWIERFKSLQSNNFEVLETSEIAPILQVADIMLSDTSSIIGEFSLLNKPTVTFKNSQPGNYLIDIQQPEQLESALESAFNPNEDLLQAINSNAQDLHPYHDGLSSRRILEAIDKVNETKKQLKSKPLNLFRKLKIRKKLGYWKL